MQIMQVELHRRLHFCAFFYPTFLTVEVIDAFHCLSVFAHIAHGEVCGTAADLQQFVERSVASLRKCSAWQPKGRAPPVCHARPNDPKKKRQKFKKQDLDKK